MSRDGAGLADEAILEELDLVLAGRALEKSPQLRAMLKYVVAETLAGRADRIKAFTIAVDVFGRDKTFDPTIDTIVRVQAGRLRAALDEHYSHERRASLLRIGLPKGSYVPSFETVAPALDGDAGRALDTSGTPEPGGRDVQAPGTPDDEPAAARPSILGSGWNRNLALGAVLAALLIGLAAIVPFTSSERAQQQQPADARQDPAAAPQSQVNTLLLAPFQTISHGPEDLRFAGALSVELATFMTRTGLLDLRTLAPDAHWTGAELRQLALDEDARWALTGVVRRIEGRHRVNVYLMDVDTGRMVWSQDYDRDAEGISADKLADAIILDLRPQLYTAAKTALETKLDLSPVEAFILATWSPGREINSYAWQLERIELARRAIKSDPDYGPAYSVLADKLSLLANYIPDFDTAAHWQEASAAAQKASVLAPHSSEVAFNLALYHFHAGDLDDALNLTRRTLELAPRHTLARFWTFVLPYACDVAPAETIEALRRFDAELSPDNPVRWQTQVWLARLLFNNRDFAAAIEAAKQSMLIMPNLGAALFLAAALVHTGEVAEAKRVFESQMVYWDGFSLDHYEAVALPRMCRSSPILEELRALHREAAAVLR